MMSSQGKTAQIKLLNSVLYGVWTEARTEAAKMYHNYLNKQNITLAWH